jgi:hypothetical protein
MTALAFAPAIAIAQTPPSNPTKAQSGPQATMQATSNGNVDLPPAFSAASRAKIDASFKAAHDKNLPDQPMRDRIAEGRVKGAGEAQIVDAVQGVETRLEASQSALVEAGHAQPKPAEIAAGASAIERGATAAQLSALVKHAPADRSLAASFSVLAKMAANGEPVDNALAKIAAKLDAGASDEAVVSLIGGLGVKNPPSDGSTGTPPASATAAGNAAAAGSAAATAGKGVTAGVTGAVTGAVSGVVPPKKP